jgi:hypothetical protein
MNTHVDELNLREGLDMHEEVVLRRAVCLYATYKLYNDIRYNSFRPRDFSGAFARYIQDALH